MLSQVAHVVATATAVLQISVLLQNSPKSHQSFWATFVIKELSKITQSGYTAGEMKACISPSGILLCL